jgi:hypothetical protein
LKEAGQREQAWRTFSWEERMCCRRFRSCFASKLHWSHINLQHKDPDSDQGVKDKMVKISVEKEQNP